jgi:hypothetical protein
VAGGLIGIVLLAILIRLVGLAEITVARLP